MNTILLKCNIRKIRSDYQRSYLFGERRDLLLEDRKSFFFNVFIYLLIFGCAGPSPLQRLFLWLWQGRAALQLPEHHLVGASPGGEHRLHGTWAPAVSAQRPSRSVVCGGWGIFLDQGSNLCLPTGRQILYHQVTREALFFCF